MHNLSQLQVLSSWIVTLFPRNCNLQRKDWALKGTTTGICILLGNHFRETGFIATSWPWSFQDGGLGDEKVSFLARFAIAGRPLERGWIHSFSLLLP